ncbi:MAG: hypothetical protein H8D78_04075 [Chloroflexi bacterium]|nr:hypothetical protein [Chloroflexota bacterium]
MTVSTRTARFITKSIRMTPDESQTIAQVSQKEHISEAALMKRFVLEGLQRYRLDRAVQFYQHGETDLSGAARYADVSVQQMMHTLRERGVEYGPSAEDFLDGLEGLARNFDDDVLKEVVAQLRAEGLD